MFCVIVGNDLNLLLNRFHRRNWIRGFSCLATNVIREIYYVICDRVFLLNPEGSVRLIQFRVMIMHSAMLRIMNMYRKSHSDERLMIKTYKRCRIEKLN